MLRHQVVMVAGLALGLSSVGALQASAQTTVQADDVAYCKKLGSMYERWGRSANSSNSMATNAALNDCGTPRTASAIAHLEQLLRAAGYSLPERSVGNRP